MKRPKSPAPTDAHLNSNSLIFISFAFLFANGCSSAAPAPFPPGFRWGVATAAQSTEGDDAHTDWDIFGRLGRAPRAGLAENGYQLFETDIENAAALNLNTFQMTIEWARIVPTAPADPTAPLAAADVDPAAVAHYHMVIDSLIAHNLTPVISVTHYALPQWVDDPSKYNTKTNAFDGSLGGWTNPVTAAAFAQYASFLTTEYGDKVKLWITMEDPLIVLIGGYMAANGPPGMTELSLTKTNLPNMQSPVSVLQTMISAHALAYRAMKQARPDAQIGLGQSSVVWLPNDPTKDVDAAARVDHVYNLLLLDAITTGAFDTGLIGTGPNEQHPEWAGSLDFIGVNYYDTDVAIDSPGLLTPLDAVPCAPAFRDISPSIFASLGCPDESPDPTPGIATILTEYQNRYHLPLYITGNGFTADGVGKAQGLVRTLEAVRGAIKQGVNVIGYHYWTLNYDYEWNEGWSQNKGLYTIAGFNDGGTFDGGAPGPSLDYTRVPIKPVVDAYSAIAKANGLPADLVAQYGH